jgi:hypothetical protein
MLTISDAALGVLSGSYVFYTRVESWQGETLLADEIPVESGTLEIDRDAGIPERVNFVVPRIDREYSWDPTHNNNHPLAPFGQQVRVNIGIELKSAPKPEDRVIEWLQLGWFVIRETEVVGDSVMVEAVGLLYLIEEARFTAPYQPAGTFVSLIRNLIEPTLTADIDAALVDRAVPSFGGAFDLERLDGINEVLDAWPADAYITSEGLLAVIPDADSSSSVATLTDGINGTVIKWTGKTSRADGFNIVVARGQKSDGTVIQGVAQDEDSSSPFYYSGSFNQLPVPFFYFSPLLTTVSQCQAAANTVLARKKRDAAKRLEAEIVPNFSLQVRDRVTVTGAGLVDQDCIIEYLSLPLTPSSGSMTLLLRVV